MEAQQGNTVSKVFTAKVPPEDYALWQAAASEQGLSVGAWVKQACAEKIAAVGTDGKSPQVSPPTMTAAATGEGKQRKTNTRKQVASVGTAAAGNPAPSPDSLPRYLWPLKKNWARAEKCEHGVNPIRVCDFCDREEPT